MTAALRRLWHLEGSVGRGAYALAGVAGFAVKFCVDWLIASAYGVRWTPLSYWHLTNLDMPSITPRLGASEPLSGSFAVLRWIALPGQNQKSFIYRCAAGVFEAVQCRHACPAHPRFVDCTWVGGLVRGGTMRTRLLRENKRRTMAGDSCEH